MNTIKETRDAIARSIRAVRLSCFGRKCLKGCQRRMATAAPHPRVARRWGVAVAAALWFLGVFAADGDRVKCVWDNDSRQYFCSGYGSVVEVEGGGGHVEVVTNFFGSCTNCINTTPEKCLEIKSTFDDYYEIIDDELQELQERLDGMDSDINRQLNDIDTFRRFGPFSSTQATSVYREFTNYINNANNTQAELALSYGNSSTYHRNLRIAFSDGIYDYANSVTKPFLESQKDDLGRIEVNAKIVQDRTLFMNNYIHENLNCEACPSSSGTNNCNECTGGRWCTEEQGYAIIELLTDTRDYVEKMQGAVISISNNVEVAVQNLHDGFFTTYDHIPTEEELGHTWQELYLEGYSPNFHEYANTNILARIELLLAGMSGVLTNDEDFVSAGEFAESGMSVTNQFESIRDDFTNSVGLVVKDREDNIRSVGDALIGLYNTFRGWSGTPFSRTTLINSYSIEIGEEHWDVPNFEPSQQGISVANIIRVICRSVMSVFYILFTVVVFVRFHIAFFQWGWKYIKWAVELMQGLFA